MATSVFIFLTCILLPGSHSIDSLRFFVIGDIGGLDIEPYTTYFQRCTAQELGKMAELYSPQFIMLLGDNFYMNGVVNVHDMRFNQTFEDVYAASSLQVPWYIVAGNHDHRGNVTAQILYSRYSKRWNFPDLYYYKEFSVSTKHTVGFVFVDTVLLCGHSDDQTDEPPKKLVDTQAEEEQWNFVQESLKNSRANYLFVAGHYPVYSTAFHGPTKCLVDRMQPMLEKYRASGYFSGHEHNLQHLRVKSSLGVSLDYFISGMANTVDPTAFHADSVPPGSSLFHYGNLLCKGGFLYAETTSANMTLTFINASGDQLYSTVVFPRKI